MLLSLKSDPHTFEPSSKPFQTLNLGTTLEMVKTAIYLHTLWVQVNSNARCGAALTGSLGRCLAKKLQGATGLERCLES